MTDQDLQNKVSEVEQDSALPSEEIQKSEIVSEPVSETKHEEKVASKVKKGSKTKKAGIKKQPIVENRELPEVDRCKNDEVEQNIALIMSGSDEVRKYSLQQHGESFLKLAQEFAKKKNYSIKMTSEAMRKKCPKCGFEY